MRSPFQLRLLLIFAASSLLSPSLRANEDTSDWKEVYREEAITVYRREIPGSDILAYKAGGLLDAPIGKILTVVTDTPRKKDWMARCKESDVLRTISPDEKVEYIRISTPWPLTDREAVYRSTMTIDPKTQRITLTYVSVDDLAKPEFKSPVRALIYHAQFTMEPVDHGRKTRFEAESHSDPKGSIPKWIVNLYQKRLPHDSIERLLKRVALPGIEDHPSIKLLGPLN
jgi:hypothetical protein